MAARPGGAHRLSCVVPAGNHAIHVQLDTICNAPAVDASGHLSFGNNLVGIINWPTCLLYPEGPTAREIRVDLTLRLPDRWKYAGALKSSGEKDGRITFQPVPLSKLADSPLIAGEHMPHHPAGSRAQSARVLPPRIGVLAALQLGPRLSSSTAGWSGRPAPCSEPAITPSFIS